MKTDRVYLFLVFALIFYVDTGTRTALNDCSVCKCKDRFGIFTHTQTVLTIPDRVDISVCSPFKGPLDKGKRYIRDLKFLRAVFAYS